jgi:hypothetical protein
MDHNKMTQETVLQWLEAFSSGQTPPDKDLIEKATGYLRKKFAQHNEDQKFVRLHLTPDSGDK